MVDSNQNIIIKPEDRRNIMLKFVSASTILFVLLGASLGSAQSFYQKEISIYAEVFGTGGELSANFEKIIDGKICIRSGIGLTGVAFRPGYAIPFGASYLLGKDRDFLELGLGGTWYDFDEKGTDSVILDLTEDQLVVNTIVGYRFIGDYGFTYRLFFSPAFTDDGYKPMGGGAFGYSF